MIAIVRVLVAIGVLVVASFSCLVIYAYVIVPASGIPDWVVALTGVIAGMVASLVDGYWPDAWARRRSRSIGVGPGGRDGA